MKDFYSVDDQVGLGDADNSFRITFEGINETVLPFARQG